MPGWTTALKVLPWAELIAAAPAVARGARKLWAAVHERDAMPAQGGSPESRLAALQAEVDALRRELAASAELVAALAEQNARLVQAVNALRLRSRALFAGCGVLAVGVVVALLR